MRSGNLRRRAALLRPEKSRDSIGGEVLTWHEVGKVWCGVYELRGREFFAAREVHSELTTKIVIRYRDDVDVEWRVQLSTNGVTRNYDIQHVIDVRGRRSELELMCVEAR